MKPAIRKIKPANGLSHLLHLSLVLVLPVVAFALVRLSFVALAFSVVVLSKWRIFAVKPRFWPANIRANAVDLMVGLSAVLFMTRGDSLLWQALWAAVYAVWLLAVKPRTGSAMVMVQSFVGQFVALSALFLAWADGPIYGLTLLSGLFCFLAARHFLDAFDEPYARMLAYIWGYFGAAMTWLLSHWLLFYGGVAQPTLLLSAIGYGLAGLYYLDHNESLGRGLRRQILFIMAAVVLVVLAFSDWGDKVI